MRFKIFIMYTSSFSVDTPTEVLLNHFTHHSLHTLCHSDIYILKSLVKYLIYEQKEQLVYSNGITTLKRLTPIDCFMMFSNAININEYNTTSPHNIPILPY